MLYICADQCVPSDHIPDVVWYIIEHLLRFPKCITSRVHGNHGRDYIGIGLKKPSLGNIRVYKISSREVLALAAGFDGRQKGGVVMEIPLFIHGFHTDEASSGEFLVNPSRVMEAPIAESVSRVLIDGTRASLLEETSWCAAETRARNVRNRRWTWRNMIGKEKTRQRTAMDPLNPVLPCGSDDGRRMETDRWRNPSTQSS
jgi:hypothetical protein